MASKFALIQGLAVVWGMSCHLMSTFAGAENISLNFQNSTCTAFLEEAPFKKVIEKVRKETGIWIIAPESVLDKRVSVPFDNLSIQEGFKRILRTMMFAAVSGQLDIVNALINQDVDLNVKNKVGGSALMLASGYSNVQKILKGAGE